MISHTLFLLAILCSGTVYVMDDEPEITPEESCRNKIKFICDTFTDADAWEHTLSQQQSFFAYMPAQQSYVVPLLPIPSARITDQLIDYSIDHKISFAMPSLLFEEGNATCIACEDTSLHLLVTDKNGTLEHHYIEPCHNKRISGIAPLSNNWFALAGGSSITCCNIQDQTQNKRITFKDIHSISGITNNNDILVIETQNRKQYELYPYSTELYKLLHGKDLNDYQIEVMFQAALAHHLEKKLTLEPDAQKIYLKLPGKLLAFLNYLLISQRNE